MEKSRMIAERYEVLAEIGRGGMGVVAHAFDHRLQTEVALKILRRDLTLDPAQTDSLVKEARVLARLTHPSVVRLFDLAETEFGLMLILEYVRGPNLAQVLKARSRLTETELIFIMRQICSGLDAAHAEGIIHRDLKPPNLLVAADSDSWESFKKGVCTSSFLLNAKVKITDFGISKLLAGRAEANAGAVGIEGTWSSAGTPLFMSPEQFQGHPSTPETDIYALGVVAYQAVSGTMPFAGESVEALAHKHLFQTPAPITACSPHINQAILRAMSKRPEDRFSSAHAFLSALEGADRAPVTVTGLQPDALDEIERWVKAHKTFVSIGCVGLVVLTAMALWLLARSMPSSPSAGNTATTQQSVLPDLGKRISLPEDMDVIPEISRLPAPVLPVPVEAAHRGPRTSHISWTALIETESELEPWVDGVGPDGTILVRERQLGTLWAIRDGSLRWSYRASKGGGGLEPLIDRNSHVDFRDPGRMWLAYCPTDIWHRNSQCHGAVFNFAGVGGHTAQVPRGIGQPVGAPGTTIPFRERDAQNWIWPESNPRLLCSSRFNVVTLAASDKRWSIPIDGRATLAIEQGDGFIVAAAHGDIYALDKSGQIQWTYKAKAEVANIQVMPSGDLMLLENDRKTLTCIRQGKLRWTYGSMEQIDEFEDYTTGTRRLGVADTASVLYFITNGGSSSTLAVDNEGKLVWTLLWAQYVNTPALHLDQAGRLFFTFQLYEIDHHSRSGVICISDS